VEIDLQVYFVFYCFLKKRSLLVILIVSTLDLAVKILDLRFLFFQKDVLDEFFFVILIDADMMTVEVKYAVRKVFYSLVFFLHSLHFVLVWVNSTFDVLIL
jgi:hypothetical protein